MTGSNVTYDERLQCPACRLKIAESGDHEPQCPNGDWDRSDVIDHIKRESSKERAREKTKSQDPWVGR